MPGIQGIGYSVHLPAARLDAHPSTIRAEGFPEYAIRPAGARAQYTSIIYLEPFDRRNQRAFGFDMFSEANRRAVMERARMPSAARTRRPLTRSGWKNKRSTTLAHSALSRSIFTPSL